LGLDRIHLFGASPQAAGIAIDYALRAPTGLASLHLANTCASIPHFERGVAQLRAALPGGAAPSSTHANRLAPHRSRVSGGRRPFQPTHFMGTDDVPAGVQASLRALNPAIYRAMVGTGLTFTGNMAGWDVHRPTRRLRPAGAGDLRTIRRR